LENSGRQDDKGSIFSNPNSSNDEFDYRDFNIAVKIKSMSEKNQLNGGFPSKLFTRTGPFSQKSAQIKGCEEKSLGKAGK
jgi:hypothetical protein